jgi:hypothetical protein
MEFLNVSLVLYVSQFNHYVSSTGFHCRRRSFTILYTYTTQKYTKIHDLLFLPKRSNFDSSEKRPFPHFSFFPSSLSKENLFLKLHVLSNGFPLLVTTSTQIAVIELILRCIKLEAHCRHSKSHSMSRRHSKRLHS